MGKMVWVWGLCKICSSSKPPIWFPGDGCCRSQALATPPLLLVHGFLGTLWRKSSWVQVLKPHQVATLPRPRWGEDRVGLVRSVGFLQIPSLRRIWLGSNQGNPGVTAREEKQQGWQMWWACKKSVRAGTPSATVAFLVCFCMPHRQAWRRKRNFWLHLAPLSHVAMAFKNFTFYSWPTFSSRS